MKVEYIKAYTDEFGQEFEVGWTAEHSETEGQKRITLGVCKQVDKETRSRRGTAAVLACVDTTEGNKGEIKNTSQIKK